MPGPAAVIFDKDGTLIDLEQTWNGATLKVLTTIVSGDQDRLDGVARDVGFDLGSASILPGSPLISESNEVIAALILPWADPALGLDGHALDQLSLRAAMEFLAPIPRADETVRALASAGVKLAVATNDSAAAAEATVKQLGWADLFGATVGYDSGYGAKPEAGMVLGAVAELSCEPSLAMMVGDSSHDIVAGNLAGLTTVQLVPNGAVESSKSGGRAVDTPNYVIESLIELLDLELA